MIDLQLAPGVSGSALARSGARPKILIVEDDFIVASELRSALGDAGFDIVGIADTADEAVRLARSARPNLAVVDIRLFGPRDGVDAAVEMQRNLDVRSIFATAHHDPATRTRGQAANPLGWLRKPYSMEAAIEAVKVGLAQLRELS